MIKTCHHTKYKPGDVLCTACGIKNFKEQTRINLGKLNQKVGDVIEKALLGYRCIHQRESDDAHAQGYPLTDALTPPWCKTTQEGREEIEHLTDHIFSQLEEAIKEGKINPYVQEHDYRYEVKDG